MYPELTRRGSTAILGWWSRSILKCRSSHPERRAGSCTPFLKDLTCMGASRSCIFRAKLNRECRFSVNLSSTCGFKTVPLFCPSWTLCSSFDRTSERFLHHRRNGVQAQEWTGRMHSRGERVASSKASTCGQATSPGARRAPAASRAPEAASSWPLCEANTWASEHPLARSQVAPRLGL